MAKRNGTTVRTVPLRKKDANPKPEVIARVQGLREMFDYARDINEELCVQRNELRKMANYAGLPYLLLLFDREEGIKESDKDCTFDDIEELLTWMKENGITRELFEERPWILEESAMEARA